MSKIVFTSLLALACASSFATWYTDENEFLLVLGASQYLEDFDDFQYGVQLNGTQTSWAAPGANGFGWNASAAQGLWSLDGAISTSDSEDAIMIDFDGLPVTAFGGIFYATDDAGFIVTDAEITLALSNGEQHVFVSDGLDFLGWTGGVALTGATLTVEQGSANWASADHIYTGTMVPEPATFAALGLGALLLLRRRR